MLGGILLLTLALILLLALNGFFVLAEFGIVKPRLSRVQEMACSEPGCSVASSSTSTSI